MQVCNDISITGASHATVSFAGKTATLNTTYSDIEATKKYISCLAQDPNNTIGQIALNIFSKPNEIGIYQGTFDGSFFSNSAYGFNQNATYFLTKYATKVGDYHEGSFSTTINASSPGTGYKLVPCNGLFKIKRDN